MTISRRSAEGSAAGALWAGLDQPLEERERRPADVSGGDDLDAGAVGNGRGVEEHPGERAPAPHHVLRLAFSAAVSLARVVLEVDEAPGAYHFHRWARMEHDAGRDAIGAEFALQCGRIAELADFEKDPAVSLLGYCPGRQPGMSEMARGMAGGAEDAGHAKANDQCHAGRAGADARGQPQVPQPGVIVALEQPLASLVQALEVGSGPGEGSAQFSFKFVGGHQLPPFTTCRVIGLVARCWPEVRISASRPAAREAVHVTVPDEQPRMSATSPTGRSAQ